MFDNSSGHSAYVKDALLASLMMKGIERSKVKSRMRDGWFMKDDIRIVQQMLYTKTHANQAIRGKAKGLQQILLERGLIEEESRMRDKCAKSIDHKDDNTCCMERLMAAQPDF